jgi:hypothetical protein
MGTEPGNVATDAAALKVKLDALVKDAEEVEEKAVAARRRARAACTLLEEEQTAAALEKAVVAACQLVPGSSSGTTHTSSAASSYEETVGAGLHLQAVAVLNVRSLVNIVLDSSSTTYASWRDLMMMVLERYVLLDHVDSGRRSVHRFRLALDGQRRPQLDQQLNHPGAPSSGSGTWCHRAPPVACYREPVSW